MAREDIAALIDRRNAGVDERDVEALVELYSEDGIVESLMGGTVTGRLAIGNIYDAWFKAFPDVIFRSDPALIDGDTAVQAAVVEGTDMGGFMGLPATGKPFRLPIVHLYKIRDGLIVHERRIYDFTGLLVQIGVIKAKPA